MDISDIAAPILAGQYLHITPESRLRQIVNHWREVRDDPNVRLPTWFSCLLQAASLAQQDEENRYADSQIRADKLERIEGANDGRHDRSVAGGSLKAGS